MFPQRSTSATIRSHGNGSVFKHSRPLRLDNRNHNNKYASLSQSWAPEQNWRQSYVTGHSTSPLGIKRPEHLPIDNNVVTSPFVNLVQESAGPYFPPTKLNYFHAPGNTEPLRQQSLGTNGQDNTLNASSMEVTPSTLNKWSSRGEGKPGYSKFTLALSPSTFPSLLFPRQVIYQIPPNPNIRIRSESSSSGDSFSDSSTDWSTSSAGEGGNANTEYVDADFITPKRKMYRRRVRRSDTPLPPPPPPYVPSETPPPALHRYKQKPQLNVTQRFAKNPLEERVATPRRAKPESDSLSDVYSPYRDDYSRTTPQSSPSSPTMLYTLGDISTGSTREEESAAPSPKAPCCRMKPPSFQLSAEFGEEPRGYERARTLTLREFEHFVNDTEMAAVMFFDGRTPQNIRKAWDKEAKEKSVPGERAYGSVDCGNNRRLCNYANITTTPMYTMYIGGNPIYSGKTFKGWK